MIKDDYSDIFRLSAILYMHHTGSTKRDGILRKIIESVFVANGNKRLNSCEITNEIKEKYNMVVVESEVHSIVTNHKYSDFKIDYSNSTLYINLSSRRYDLLAASSENNIEFYVSQFIIQYGYEASAKDLIYNFIYTLYCKSLNDFNKVFGDRKNVIELLDELDITEYSPEENEIIKEFLSWDNNEKNALLSSIASYALEYVLLTGNSNILNRKNITNIFANKNLYIDTNIIFYCLGINGSDYATSNRTFLKKCIDSRESIFISYYTDEEIKKTFNHFQVELERYATPAIYNKRIASFISNKDVYSYYIKWSSEKKLMREPKYFKQFLLDEYEKLIQEFNITVERSIPFKEQELVSDETFQKYEDEIFCNSEINYDARNIYLIEKKRHNDEINIESVKTIFISADTELQKWDADRNSSVPVVIGPSLWLILLTRFISRSEDDYKCFVSYININTGDQVINNKEFMEVVCAINQLTEDVSQQETIINVMVQEEFQFLNNNGIKRSPDFIEKKTKEEASKIIDSIMQQKDARIQALEDDRKNVIEENQKYADICSQQQQIIMETEQINETVRKDTLNTFQSQNDEIYRLRLQNRRLVSGAIMAIVTIPIIIELISIFVFKNQNPLSYRICYAIINKSIFDTGNYSYIEMYGKALVAIVSFVVTVVDVFLSRIFWDKKFIYETMNKAESKSKDTYKKSDCEVTNHTPRLQ